MCFCAFIIDRAAEAWTGKEERGNDMQQGATRRNQTQHRCNEDTASVHEEPAQPTELPQRLLTNILMNRITDFLPNLDIVGNIWGNMNTQFNKIYNESLVFYFEFVKNVAFPVGMLSILQIQVLFRNDWYSKDSNHFSAGVL